MFSEERCVYRVIGLGDRCGEFPSGLRFFCYGFCFALPPCGGLVVLRKWMWMLPNCSLAVPFNFAVAVLVMP